MVKGERATLRAATETDFELIARLRSDEEVAHLLLTHPRGCSPAQAKAWVESVTSNAKSLLFIVEDAKSGHPAGFVHVSNIDVVNGHAEFGICIAEDFRRLGLGRESLTLLEQYLKRVFNLRKLTLQVLDGNDAEKLYLALGYELVGRLTQHFFWDGKYEDVLVMEHVFSD